MGPKSDGSLNMSMVGYPKMSMYSCNRSCVFRKAMLSYSVRYTEVSTEMASAHTSLCGKNLDRMETSGGR